VNYAWLRSICTEPGPASGEINDIFEDVYTSTSGWVSFHSVSSFNTLARPRRQGAGDFDTLAFATRTFR
jgi:hypothetical protein